MFSYKSQPEIPGKKKKKKREFHDDEAQMQGQNSALTLHSLDK